MNLKIKKTLAGTFGVGLIILLLLFVNSFVGNPVSNALAKKAAQQYIDANYSELNLQIQRCTYNFKISSYSALVQSNTSQDTVFRIDVDSFGGVLRDDYEYEVANNFTTFRRLDEELGKIAEEIIGSKLDYNFENIFLLFVKEADIMELDRDMKLDINNPPLPLMVDVTVFSNDVSYNKIAEIAKALENVLGEQNIPVDEYSVRILPLSNKPKNENQAATWVNSLSLTSFPATQLGEENLSQVMEHFATAGVSKRNEEKDKK